MIRLTRADLRESWVAWLGVGVAFVVTNASLVLCVILMSSANAARTSGTIDKLGAEYLRISGQVNIITSSLVALAVIGASTALVVSSRRGAIARLLLGGATPGQVTRLITGQVAVTALAAGILGDLIAIASAPTVIRLVAEDRKLPPVETVYSLPWILLGNLICLGVCVVGALKQARRASRIPPVEALREATGRVARREGPVRTVLRGLRFVAAVAIVAGAFPFFKNQIGKMPQDDAFGSLMQFGILLIPVTGMAIVAILPWVIAPVTRAWTRILPLPTPAWHLARHTVVAKSDRMVRSVTPVMFAVGFLFGFMAVMDTFVGLLTLMGVRDIEGASVTSLLVLIGLPLVIAVAGAVGNLVMMSRQRSAELALDGIVGATPRQQMLVPLFEALILTVTAALLGLVMAAVGNAFVAYGLNILYPGASMAMPWPLLGVSSLLCLAVVALATVLPVLPSLRQPAPKVIARLVAA